MIASTASPFKFTRSVMNAIDTNCNDMDDFALVDKLADISNRKVPRAIDEIRNAPVRHNTVCQAEEMESVIKKFLGITK